MIIELINLIDKPEGKEEQLRMMEEGKGEGERQQAGVLDDSQTKGSRFSRFDSWQISRQLIAESIRDAPRGGPF